MRSFPFIMFVLMACNPGVEQDIIPVDRLVSVNSFISPQDSLLSVYVKRGVAVGDTIFENQVEIPTAIVKMATGSDTVQLTYNPLTSRFEGLATDLPIRSGETYFLFVKTPDNITLKATCTVPPELSDLSLTLSPQDDTHYKYTMQWTAVTSNPSGDYLITTPEKELINAKLPTLIFDYNDVIPVTGGAHVNPYDSNPKQTIGKNIRTGTISLENIKSLSVQAEVRYLSDGLYAFLSSMDQLKGWSTAAGDIIPVLKEPEPLISNIEGGVGYFGAYNRTQSAPIKLK
ncbi:MAG: DUF4249 family protein [Siphonobacter sp.]